MLDISGWIFAVYRRVILERPRAALAVLLLALAFFSYHAKDFALDASADSLLLEDDKDLQMVREVAARYQDRDLLIVTFSVGGDVFSEANLSHLRGLRDELEAVDGVDSVLSVLDAPLLTSSGIPLEEMMENVQTLESPTVDRKLARRELIESPVFRDLVINRDGSTAGILIALERDDVFAALQGKRNELLIKKGEGELSADEQLALAEASEGYQRARTRLANRDHATIQEARSVIDRYRQHGALHMGGVPMIMDDMVRFVKNDLIVFGSCVVVFLAIVLTLIFRRVRWVALPLGSCLYASAIMIGMLGLIGWEVTVISSNFLALMLIITISMNIHLTVRYSQLLTDRPKASQLELVSETVRMMVWPCLYTAVTTIIGFSSLVVSNIKPVRDFGWMMSVGLAVAFITSFTLFPAILAMLKRPEGKGSHRKEVPITHKLAGLTERHGASILLVAALLAVFSAIGMSRLTVENSFIGYFREYTEIHRGMKLIDRELGGTTPLEILLNFDPAPEIEEVAVDESTYDDDYLDGWELSTMSDPAYWFTPFKIDRIKQVHDYLDSRPEVGKVLSLASGIRAAESLNGGEEFDGIELSLLYKKLPEEIKEALIDPYFSFEHNEARIQMRILDSTEGLRRKDLIESIESDLRTQLGLKEHEVTLTGTLVLYNNMLQSLFSSQISSIGAVMAGIGITLLLLFRSFSLAIIGIVPNLLAAAIVLGLMGWVGIPLDLMTITIAAITIGIAVDNGIHYIYRFREEFRKSSDYSKTLQICHANIGRAVFYTSTTVVFGFSILMLSKFLPTIYFGVLTGLAMIIAFLAALTLLPKLILLFKPFGGGHGVDRESRHSL